MKVLRDNKVEIGAIVGLMLLTSIVGGYILVKQRLPLPWKDTYDINARFISAQAVTPGQGQQVAVAGVPVGEITRVSLDNGVAVVRMTIERKKLQAVHADARALLRPKTPLQDMQVQLDPGSSRAATLPNGGTLPERATTPQVQVDRVLASLDSDTRAYLSITIDAIGRGLRHRSADIRRLLRSFGPTLEDAKAVTSAVNARRQDLRHLVGSLRRITERLGPKEHEIAQLVSSAERTFTAIGDEDRAVGSALNELPATLRATREALDQARPLARELPPAVDRLLPVLRTLTPALRDVRPLLRAGAPDLASVRSLVRDARPLGREATPALRALREQTPDLHRTFGVLEELANELAYNPAGPEEGYLFWLAWFAHNVPSVLSTGDANGAVWHGMLAVSCDAAAVYPRGLPAAVGALFDLARVCPKEVR
jgi:phospholipid/cholesterol/gamma-HCH transport system substrate-binding protein